MEIIPRFERGVPGSSPGRGVLGGVSGKGQPIGDGKPGPVARALLGLIDADMRDSDRLIDVPYR